MGFWDEFANEAGKALGKMAAQVQEVQQYKPEYERMGDRDLKREYKYLKEKGDGWPGRTKEEDNRLKAVVWVLKDRGYGN